MRTGGRGEIFEFCETWSRIKSSANPPPPPSCHGRGGVNATQVFSPMKSSKILPQEGESTVGPRREAVLLIRNNLL